MKIKVYVVVAAVLLLTVLSAPAAFGAANLNSAPPAVEKQINLTDVQKSELKQLYGKRFEIEKQIVQKYLDYGVFTKEQADKRLEKIEKIRQKIEQNGFIPKYKKGFEGREKSKGMGSQTPAEPQTE